MAISASFIPFSIPLTSADIPTRLETPRMIPNIVSRERNLCAQISFNPTAMAFSKFMLQSLCGWLRDDAVQPGQLGINFLGDLAIAYFNAARRDGGDFRVMGHQRDGAP